MSEELENDWRCDKNYKQINHFLFNNKEMSDVKFILDTEILYAHSWKLAERSLVFYEKFKDNFGMQKLITIDDYSYDSFNEFLKYIYLDVCDLEEENVFEIFELAEKFSISKLELFCKEWITDNLNAENACEFLNSIYLSESCSNTLQALVFCYIADNFINVLQSTSFLKSNKKIIKYVLQLDNIYPVEEVVIFKYLIQWANYNNRVNLNSRIVLDGLINLIRFPLMTPEEFTECLTICDDFLTPDEFQSIFTCIADKTPIPEGFIKRKRKFRFNLSDLKTITVRKMSPNISLERGFNDLQTIFTVDRKVILTHILLGNTSKDQDCRITVRCDQNILFNASVKTERHVSPTITFNPPLNILPETRCVIDLYYSFDFCVYQVMEDLNLLAPLTKEFDGVRFTFEKLSGLVNLINFKKFD